MRSALIVGSGFIARQHAQAIQAEPDVRLAAFVNPNPKNAEKLAEEFGCAYYPGLKEAMAGTRADIVDVCAPTHLHEQYVVEAAGLGCHVLCEKPVTFTLESFDRILKDHASSSQFLPAKLKRAQSLLRMSLKPAAAKAFREIVDGFPGTPEARTAEQELNDLNG